MRFGVLCTDQARQLAEEAGVATSAYRNAELESLSFLIWNKVNQPERLELEVKINESRFEAWNEVCGCFVSLVHV